MGCETGNEAGRCLDLQEGSSAFLEGTWNLGLCPEVTIPSPGTGGETPNLQTQDLEFLDTSEP